MRRPRRRSILRSLLELPLRLVFAIGIIVIRLIIAVRNFLPVSLLLLLCAVVPVVGYSLQWLDGAGSWIMLGTALTLAFAAGSLRNKR